MGLLDHSRDSRFRSPNTPPYPPPRPQLLHPRHWKRGLVCEKLCELRQPSSPGVCYFAQWRMARHRFPGNKSRCLVAALPHRGYRLTSIRSGGFCGSEADRLSQAWHISEGLGVVFLEDTDQIAPASAQYDQTCQQWNNYQQHAVYAKTDSGL